MMDYYLLPLSFIKARSVCLALNDPRWEGYRFTSLDGVLGKLYQIQIREFAKAAVVDRHQVQGRKRRGTHSRSSNQ